MRETERDWQLAEARSVSQGPGTRTGFSSKTKWDLSNEPRERLGHSVAAVWATDAGIQGWR